jgi:hypothetical protein
MKRWLHKLLHPDRRRAARWETDRLVAYYWDGSPPAPRRVVNVSSSGFFLETTCTWQRGTLITMTLQKANVHGESVRPGDYIVLISRVAWRNDDGVGLEFIPREHAANANIRAVGSPATQRSIQLFLEKCHAEHVGPKMRFSAHAIASHTRR